MSGRSGAADPRARDPTRGIRIMGLGSGIEPTQRALAPVGIRRVKEILTNSLTTDELVQTTALVKEIESVVKKNMYSKLLIAVAAVFLRRQWLGPPAGGASRSLSGPGSTSMSFQLRRQSMAVLDEY